VGFVYVDHILQYLLSNYPVWARIANPTKKAKANGRSSASCVRRRARCGSVPLLATGFDRRSAPALGLSPAFADAALLVLLAAAIVVAVQGLGNLLVVAVFVGPAAAARQLSDRMVPTMVLAAALAALAGVVGLYLSYYAGTAGGASVALSIVAVYLLALPLGRLRVAHRAMRIEPEATIA
jgi:hypothetical protein